LRVIYWDNTATLEQIEEAFFPK